MISASVHRKRAALGVAAVVALMWVGVAGAGEASAAIPWWHVNTVSAPAGKVGGEAQVLFELSDLGETAVRAFEHPVAILAKLPAGVTPTAVYGRSGPGEFWSPFGGFNTEATHCAFLAQIVTCAFEGALLDYEHLMIAVTVKVTPGAGNGVSEMNVSGGGAPGLLSRHALALEGLPAEGVSNYEITSEEEGGGPDTQAGSHPFQLTTTLTLDTKTETVSSDGVVLPEIQPVAITKDLRFQLPPGLLGNPTPLPKCSIYVFTREAGHPNEMCPRNTVVGVATYRHQLVKRTHSRAVGVHTAAVQP